MSTGFTIFAVLVGCGGRSIQSVDSGPSGDAGRDGGGSDGGTVLDAGQDAGDAGRDATIDSGEDSGPNVYPCEDHSDCNEWYRGAAFCLGGFCCLGHDVGGICMCGDEVGGCPPGVQCCFLAADPYTEACAHLRDCASGP